MLSISSTGLSPSMAQLSSWIQLYLTFFLNRSPAKLHERPTTPNQQRLQAYTDSVWTLPRSLAATCGISFDVSSSGYLDVSVRRVSPSMPIYSAMGDRGSPLPGSPIRISPDLCLLTAPRSVSPFTASFFASWYLGIHHTPFLS